MKQQNEKPDNGNYGFIFWFIRQSTLLDWYEKGVLIFLLGSRRYKTQPTKAKIARENGITTSTVTATIRRLEMLGLEIQYSETGKILAMNFTSILRKLIDSVKKEAGDAKNILKEAGDAKKRRETPKRGGRRQKEAGDAISSFKKTKEIKTLVCEEKNSAGEGGNFISPPEISKSETKKAAETLAKLNPFKTGKAKDDFSHEEN